MNHSNTTGDKTMMQTNALIPWSKAHPWQALRRAAWILFNLSFCGASAAFFAWGPLAGGLPLMVLLGIVGGLAPTALWAWQQRLAIQGPRTRARRWWRILLAGQIAIVAGIGLLVARDLYRVGMIAPPTQNRVANFDRLWQAMDIYYPYFEMKEIDWDAMRERYRPQVEQTTSDAAYHEIIESMLAELNDAHTGLSPSLVYDAGCKFAVTREMAGEAVVVVSRRSAQEVGLEIGSVILTVDGEPIEQALEAVDFRLREGSTPWQRRNRAFQSLLYTPMGGQREITFETPDGVETTAILACTEAIAQIESEGAEVWELMRPGYERQIVSRRLPSGLGYLRVPTLGTDLVAEFDAALDELMDTPGLILDLRGNGGGNSAYADQMAGRFLGEPFVYGRDYYGSPMSTRGWREWMPFSVTPRAPIYTGPVVVIIETNNMSSAEQFLASLVDSGRVETVGQRTGGASANPVRFSLPGGRAARFSTANFRRNDGTPIEGMGFTPDVEVAWTAADLRQGRDVDLEAAERLLLGDLAREH